ncbi:hypothetical protein [Streptomyces chartreusis]|uniref:hypothetical protein n=1 Tax=Streptomyces chartreusis TaxID=1969 RepID=UPI0037F2E6B3
MSTANLEAELRAAAERQRRANAVKGRIDSDSRDLLEVLRVLLRLPEPLARWLDEQAQHVARSGMYDVLAVDVARAINGISEPGRGEDGHITDRHSGAYLYEQVMRAAGETP